VPIAKVEEAIFSIMENDRLRKEKFTYVFDGFMHKTA